MGCGFVYGICLCWRTFYRPAKRIDFDGVGWGGAITFIGTYTHTWCYATARSSATSTHTWCYATARSSATSAHTWCYATARSSATSTHTWCYAGVGWGNNVHCHLHTYVMLRHCTFFCNLHTYVMLRHCTFFCNFRTYVMLRHCTFFCNFRTYVMLRHCTFFCNFHTYVTLRWGGVGWGNNVPMAVGKPTRVVEDNCDIHQATVLIRLRASWRRKNAERVVDGKVKQSSSETPFFQSKWRFAMAKR